MALRLLRGAAGAASKRRAGRGGTRRERKRRETKGVRRTLGVFPASPPPPLRLGAVASVAEGRLKWRPREGA